MIIETKNLVKRYKKVKATKLFHKEYRDFVALQNINFQLKQGEHLGLVGLNGSGKSTLIKLILGILQPSSGSVRTFDMDPLTNRQKNAQKIGVVFGQRSQLRWDLPAMDTFKLNREIYQVPEEIFDKRVKNLAEMLDATDFLLQPVRTLSLGQRMKAEFIAALIHDPDLIILDEPTIGLDVLSKNSITQFLQKLTNKTIIFTSHDLDEVEKVCSRTLILSHGQLVLDKSSKELAKLDVPSTVTFTSKNSLSEAITAKWPTINRSENGSYQLTGIMQEELKSTLSMITASVEVDSIEVKNNKLEYLLAHLTKQEVR
ncbi:ABC-2 type transport system ATP-binding protein [Lactobacillus apis]|uniref:ABC transporter ATP-binding protein n=1 Tax=Lactobacillus apis TaxID=303541 RepID=UPI0008158516|nr:ATP-binding cassette domain-containing protein [Lactobacillus apis]GGG39318.1 peptide ABC transporter ATP-binding protein [Lactobacillus apis]SCC07183.1 ABC-2 type transport system ATP-binding protein [Lactobacillus apis]